jgi:hypothetical protein
LLSGFVLLLTIFAFWSCEKKEKENPWEKELIGSWNFDGEYKRLDFNQIQDSSNYTGTIVFYNDNSFEYNLDEPLTYLYTKGAWKAVGDQIYMSFYNNLSEYSGKYEISYVDGAIQLLLSFEKTAANSFVYKMKLTK